MSTQENFEQERKAYIQEIEKMNKSISNILQYRQLDLATPEQLAKIQQISEKNQKFQHKLESNEFEIAIVGLEKAGKSTFANALINNYVLPSAPERCTFTSTRLVSGSNKALVEFYKEEEFNHIFVSMLKEIEYPEAEKQSFRIMTLEEFENYFDELSQSKPAIYKNHLGKTDEEIKDILKYKVKLTLDGSIKEFSGEQLSTDEFQSYIKGEKKGEIHDVSKPLSVKRVEIESSQLKAMENAIIYDVPGFDSPTQLHTRQTEERLKSADVIILVTNAGRNPSIQGTSLNIITKNTDEDGIELKDKLFVFGNQIDLVNKTADILGNRTILVNDVKRYQIGEEKRVFTGSALKYLVENSIIDDNEYSCNFDISSGISEIRESLVEYYQTERFDILKRKIDSNRSEIKKIFTEMYQQSADSILNGGNPEYQRNVIFLGEEGKIKHRLIENLKKFMSDKKDQIYKEKWLSDSLREAIETNINFSPVDEEDFKKAYIRNDESIRQDCPYEKINSALRSNLHQKMLQEYIQIIKQITGNSCLRIENDLLNVFTVSVAGNNHYSEQVQEQCFYFVQKLTENISHNEQRFNYLVERFSRGIFDIILEFPVGNSDRIRRFEKNQPDIIMLDHYYSRNKGRLACQLLTQKNVTLENGLDTLMATSLKAISEIVKTNPQLATLRTAFDIASIITKVKDPSVLMDKHDITRANSPTEVIEEINQDIDNLKSILIQAVIPAIDLEVTFVNSLDKQIKLILNSLKSDDDHSEMFNKFISSVVLITKKSELDNIDKVIELQKRKQEILEEIQKF